MRGNRPLNRLAAAFEHTARIGDTSLLHVAIFKPLVVVAAPARWSSCFLAEAVAQRDSSLVGLDLVIPHAESKKDVRSHVLRMIGFGRNLRVDARGPQAERSVDRVVVTMNQVVNDARMPRMLRKNLFEYGGGAHVSGEIAAVLRSAQNGQRIEAGGIHVFGKLPVQFSEHEFVAAVTFFLSAIAEENLDALEVKLFPLR